MAILIVSCSESSDSDENTLNNTASIVGNWKYLKDVTVLCDDGGEEVILYSTTCEQKSGMTFNEDGSFSNYWYGDDQGNCLYNSIEYGTYRIEYDYYESEYDVTSDVLWLYFPEEETSELGYHLFELSSSILKWGEYYTHTGVGCSVGEYYYYEYVRVE